MFLSWSSYIVTIINDTVLIQSLFLQFFSLDLTTIFPIFIFGRIFRGFRSYSLLLAFWTGSFKSIIITRRAFENVLGHFCYTSSAFSRTIAAVDNLSMNFSMISSIL